MIKGLKIGMGLAAAALFVVATGMTAASAATAPAPEATWLVAAHQSNLAEIAAGTDAQKNATNADIKMIGKHFVSDHTSLDAGVKTLANKYGVDLPSAPSKAQQAALASVKQKSGSAYDTAWTSSQLTGHLQTRTKTRTYLAAGTADDVLAAAKKAAPVVQMHIDELTSLAKDLGVPTSVNGGTGGQAAMGHPVLASSLTGGGLVVVLGAVVMARRRRSSIR